jgi:hypothetical protein
MLLLPLAVTFAGRRMAGMGGIIPVDEPAHRSSAGTGRRLNAPGPSSAGTRRAPKLVEPPAAARGSVRSKVLGRSLTSCPGTCRPACRRRPASLRGPRSPSPRW